MQVPLKNAIDMGSRPFGQSAFDGKPAAVGRVRWAVSGCRVNVRKRSGAARTACGIATGRPGTPQEIDAWIAEIPDATLERMFDDAQQQFGRLADEFMRDTELKIKEVIDSSILTAVEQRGYSVIAETKTISSEVKRYTSSFRSFGINVLAGVVAGLLFGIIALFFYYYNKASPPMLATVEQAPKSQDRK